MGTSFKFSVDPSGFIRSVRNVQNGQFAAISDSLLEVGNEIMDDSKDNYCPVESGDLRDTGRVESSGSGSQAQVMLLYGGNGVNYAVPVHEGHRIVAWGHDTGRMQPPTKFLETPMLIHAAPDGDAWQKVASDFMGFSARAWNG